MLIKKSTNLFVNLIYTVCLILWAIITGTIIGIIGKTISHFEDFRQLIREEYWFWKRYPKYSYNKYIRVLLDPILFAKNEKLKDYWETITYEQNFRLENPNTPLITIKVFFIILTAIILLPIRWFIGILEGIAIVIQNNKKYMGFKFNNKEETNFQEILEDFKNNKKTGFCLFNYYF